MRPHVPEDLPRQAMQQLDVAILRPHTANQMAYPVHQRFLLLPEQITNRLERNGLYVIRVFSRARELAVCSEGK